PRWGLRLPPDPMLARHAFRSFSLSLLLTIASAAVAPAQTATIFPHPDDSPWWLSGQLNLISQTHGKFTSPYEGDNSLRSEREQALSRLWTIYTGVRLP